MVGNSQANGKLLRTILSCISAEPKRPKCRANVYLESCFVIPAKEALQTCLSLIIYLQHCFLSEISSIISEPGEFFSLNNSSTKSLTNQPTINHRSHFVFAESCAAAALPLLQPPLISQPPPTDGHDGLAGGPRHHAECHGGHVECTQYVLKGTVFKGQSPCLRKIFGTLTN